MHNDTTITAICTPPGSGAIATIRLSGPEAIAIADTIWQGRPLTDTPSHTARLGTITDSDGQPLDQVLATIFRAPHSFTGEDTVEISCHGSRYIQQSILNALIDAGATPAAPGEFSQRAFINRKIDLAQAEGIADLISAQSRAAHRLALTQTKGTYSSALEAERQKLIQLASMLELELDFAEEDVQFADRTTLLRQASELRTRLNNLAQTFAKGQAIRDGHPIAIVGAPNAGKSTLINTIIADDIAIVSDIPGTTRDAIQATATIGPHLIRFIDTAGLRDTDDTIEALGIDRTLRHIANATIIIWLLDPTTDLPAQTQHMHTIAQTLTQSQTLIPVIGKADLVPPPLTLPLTPTTDHINIDSRTTQGIKPLIDRITAILDTDQNQTEDIIITNARHYAALRATVDALDRTIRAIEDGHTADLITLDLRDATHHLGTITGAITTDTLLTHIFSHFCIGK